MNSHNPHRTSKGFLSASITRTSGIFIFIVSLPIVVSMILTSLGVPVKGFEWVNPPPPKVKAKTPEPVALVDFKATPAGNILTAFFKRADKIWSPTSTEVVSARLPHPLGCVAPAPTLSDSKAYKTKGPSLQVTFAAYPAGLGGAMFDRLYEKVLKCKPTGTTVHENKISDVGTEGATLKTSWASNNISTTFFRRGDVIIFVASDADVSSEKYAKVLDPILKKLLTPELCPMSKSSSKDGTRNAFFSGKSFTGKQRGAHIVAPKYSIPPLSGEQESKGVKQVPFPAKKLKIKEANIPSDQVSFPLWPLLPKAVKLPTAPTPPPKQKLAEDTLIRIEDPIGPGCGWEFLSTLEPTFDEATVDANNKKIINDAQVILNNDGPRWQEDISKYWTNYHAYVKASKKYNNYRAEVVKVTKAWNKIKHLWAVYNKEHYEWEVKEYNRKEFLRKKKAEQKEYDTLKGECSKYNKDLESYSKRNAAYEEKIEYYSLHPEEQTADYEAFKVALEVWNADPKPVEERGPKPKDPTPVKPEIPTPPNTSCPVPKPAILSESGPKAAPEPPAPADPRPRGEEGAGQM